MRSATTAAVLGVIGLPVLASITHGHELPDSQKDSPKQDAMQLYDLAEQHLTTQMLSSTSRSR